MSNLKDIIDVCEALQVPLESVQLYAGYKEILFTLPDSIINGFRDADGNLTDAYDVFCNTHGIWYTSDTKCWVA